MGWFCVLGLGLGLADPQGAGAEGEPTGEILRQILGFGASGGFGGPWMWHGVAWQWPCACVTCDPQWPEPQFLPV